MKYDLKKLPNGLSVLKVPVAASESVLVNFFVKTGSRNETAVQRGISHFLEHLLFKGSKRYPNAKILSSTVEAVGAEYNAATSREYTLYYIKAASKHLPLLVDVLSDMLLQAKLDPVEIEREKGVIIEEMNMYRDTPMRHIGDVLEEVMWPKSDLGEPIIGNEKTVRGAMRKDLINYIDKNYVSDNVILSFAGNFDDKEVDRLIAKYWSKFPQKFAPEFTPAPKPVPGNAVKIENKKTQQGHLALGFYGYDYNHEDNYALELLANVLGGGMSSRLFTEIRERRGLAYYVRMGIDSYRDTGSAVISSGLKLENIEEALKVIATEIRKIKKFKVGSGELKKSKENLKGRMTLSLEDLDHRLEWYLVQSAFHKKILSPKEAFAKIDKVTPANIQEQANRIFDKKLWKLAVIGPYKGKESKFQSLLKF